MKESVYIMWSDICLFWVDAGKLFWHFKVVFLRLMSFSESDSLEEDVVFIGITH